MILALLWVVDFAASGATDFSSTGFKLASDEDGGDSETKGKTDAPKERSAGPEGASSGPGDGLHKVEEEEEEEGDEDDEEEGMDSDIELDEEEDCPGSVEEVLAELHTVLGEEQGWSPSSPDAPEINYSVVSKLHHLKSYITDVLRLYSSAWLLRGVMKDQTVTLETGERIILSKGENIVCVNPHVNEEVFAEPHLAKTTRFLPNTRIKDAQGRDVKLPTMMFGHGIYRCPGEQFAYLELVTTVAFMWTCYDFELANPWIKDEPQPNLSRVGFGVMPLDHKFLNHESVQVRFRSRY
ncbi:hydroxycholest-4-en-3-one 12-alpha-hydroxylase [Seminavis robusta]|uniref:Hydroxycholest-4-en-3-one 12-alpha-hydroxylase n=1 Tax=Seminavis robusta TaxID=568900 RepID=A0A9N8HYD7_9STRA|nr:hydroxycholest-4-en-3-one 12-alpha-hydroxylase [Seminavis robusta]|eukprot:Sro1977_g308930.1 hydroxycholest-4-en-3-one 12-alpha-hydroxylase (296) ;mRNA; f:9440-10443